MTTTVYFNGAFIDKARVHISPDDRGFLLADGIYEVVRSYAGRLFEFDAHLARLRHGLRALRIDGVDLGDIERVFRHLIERNGLAAQDAMVYLQITRGAAPRVHAFPQPPVSPTLYVEAKPIVTRGDARVGIGVITVPDIRWARCDIKSIAILANCLANQRAQEAGAVEAIMVRDGVALEGSATSFFAIIDGEVRTAPASNYILRSVTRGVVLRLCAEAGIAARETSVFAHELPDADELFLAGTTSEVMPIVQLDGQPVGTGKPGPMTTRLAALFRELTDTLRD
ncbi:MAG TPA: aminotransferase class IV [Gemmatimonadales bacterium]